MFESLVFYKQGEDQLFVTVVIYECKIFIKPNSVTSKKKLEHLAFPPGACPIKLFTTVITALQ